MEAVRPNSKADTTTSKASGLKKKKTRHRTLKSSLECQICRNPTDKVMHCKTCTTRSMWFQKMPTMPGRENDHFTSKQEKLTKRAIGTNV